MKEQILKLRKEGKTYKEIVEELNCAKSTVSYHCGKGQKEKQQLRNSIYTRDKCSCGEYKSKVSIRCADCTNKYRSKKMLKNTIGSYININNPGVNKFTNVRKHARKTLEESGIIKSCKICSFNTYVEVCHIKAISSFPLDTTLSEVNHIDNLVYLCPNHHILLDKGLISL